MAIISTSRDELVAPRLSVNHVVVVGGGGLMGSGIAQVAAQAGMRVTIVDLDEGALERGLTSIEGSLNRLLRGERLLTAEASQILARIATSSDIEEAASTADHVIETVVEELEAKLEVMRRLDEICDPDVIFASNTSQFSISKLGAATKRPDRVIGSHWFNPPPVMRLIELVCGVETSDATLDAATDLARRYGKEVIVCRRDTPGFITSRLIAILIMEATRIVEEGIADAEDVNQACVLAFNHALGPLDTADLSGLDVVERVGDSLAKSYGERFLPPPLLRALVSAGHLGRKTGQGFRAYGDDA
jgi:3-hydroxybutyryl-CoA dehydrogenase